MTSAVALALMAKASAVFGGDGTFLSFPLTPISFTKKQLSFLTDAGDPASALASASEFAFIVNQIPSGPVWPTVDTGPLWQEYSRILKQAELANEQRSKGEEAQYQAALALLYVTGPDGMRTDSPLVVTYRMYRDAYLNARQQFTSRKIAADNSTDPAVKAQWASDQPALQNTVTAALNTWQSQGQKGRVEDARRVESSLGAKSPAATWTQWASLADPDVVAVTDLASARFFPTAFAPTSAVDSPQWQEFELNAGEVANLAAHAPPELAARLGGGSSDAFSVESLKFEFTSVTITRPWFVPDVFDARFWKLNSPPNVVSDGKTPPHGTIPGYTVAMVFARNIEVKLAPSRSQTPSDASALMLGPLHANTIVDAGGNRIVLSAVSSGGVRPILLQRATQPQTAPTPVQPFNLASILRANTTAPVAASAQQFHAAPTIMRLGMLNFGRVQPQPLPQPVVQPVNVPPHLPDPPDSSSSSSSASAQPPPDQPPAPPPDDQIFVLGFICKPVPKSPNPDPSLPW